MKKVLFSALLFPLSCFANDITTCQDLQNMQQDLAAKYVLTADIDCSGFKWTPIVGTFTGQLDGQNHRILNLVIKNQKSSGGLFETLERAQIKDIIVEDAALAWYGQSHELSVGFIAAQAHDSVFQNVRLKEVAIDVHDSHAAGLVVGSAVDTLFEKVAINNSRLQASTQYAGLMVGSFIGNPGREKTNPIGIVKSKVIASELYASNPSIHSAFGGITGYSKGLFLSNNAVEKITIATAKKTARNVMYMGALSGIADINNNFVNFNKITDAHLIGAQYAGGMFGKMRLTSCLSHDTISQNRIDVDMQVKKIGAGFTSKIESAIDKDISCDISNSEVRAHIVHAPNSEPIAAGFIGLIETHGAPSITIKNNYVLSNLAVEEIDNRSGFVHSITKANPAPVFISNFWNKELAQTSTALPLENEDGAVGLTTLAMQDPQTYVDAGWDMDAVWYMPSNQYPRLLAIDLK
jgi:hypothetical protein